jgi:hypothetical protein
VKNGLGARMYLVQRIQVETGAKLYKANTELLNRKWKGNTYLM